MTTWSTHRSSRRTVKPGPTGVFTASIPLVGVAEGDYTIELVRRRRPDPLGVVHGPPDREAGLPAGGHDRPSRLHRGRPDQGHDDRDVLRRHAGPRRPASDRRHHRARRHDGRHRHGHLPDHRRPGRGPGGPDVRQLLCGARHAKRRARSPGRPARSASIPSSRWIDAESSIAGGRVLVTGGVHLVDVDRLETELAGGQSLWDVDPRGAAVAGATVTVRFIEQIPIRTQTGTEYDFIEKRVVPVYEYEVRERDAGTVRVKTAANGSYKASIKATPNGPRLPRARVGRRPGQARRPRVDATPAATPGAYGDQAEAVLQTTDPATRSPGVRHRRPPGPHDGGSGHGADLPRRHALPVLSSPSAASGRPRSSRRPGSSRRTSAGPSPDLLVSAVRFTEARLRRDGRVRRLVPRLRPRDSGWTSTCGRPATRRARPRPSTSGPRDSAGCTGGGHGRAAGRRREAVRDGRAPATTTRSSELYQPVGSMIVASRASHRTPRSQFEGGDTTGGGDDGRDDFRDFVLFQSVDTGPDGRGTVTFQPAGRPDVVARLGVGHLGRSRGRVRIRPRAGRAAVLRRCDDRARVPRRRPTVAPDPRLRVGRGGRGSGHDPADGADPGPRLGPDRVDRLRDRRPCR